jgi:iron complex outermembrane receptor protein
VGKFVPNLNVTGFSAGHTSSANPFIRGIGLQDHLITTDPGVSVYVDGVYLGRQVGQNWNLNNIERIEVLRGPQGTLYGRNSIGGAINIITKEPNDENEGKISVEAGTRGRAKADVFINHHLSSDWSFNLNAGYNRRNGLGQFLNVDSEYDVGETRDAYARLSVKYAPSDDFSLVLTADGNDGEGGLRPYTTLINEVPTGALFTGQRFGAPTPAGPLRNSDVAANPFDNNTGSEEITTVSNDARGISATADWNWNGSLGSKLIVSHRTSEYKAGLDDDGTIFVLDQFPETGGADQTSIEFQFNGYLGNVDFVSGLYYFNEDGDNNQGLGSTFNGAPNLLQLQQETTSKAAFINVGYDASDALRLSGGLRYTDDKKEASAGVGFANANDVLAGIANGTPVNPQAVASAEEEANFNELSFEVAANYTFNNGINLYGTIQSGYQSGQFPARPFCLFGDLNCFVASENISAINYEIGVKGQVTDWLSTSIAAFNTNYTDLPYQVSTTAVGGFSTTNLVVDQTSQGLELESTIALSANFKVHLSAGYIDVDVDEQDGVQPVAPLTPDLTASISPTYSWDRSDGSTVDFRVDYSFRDEMFGEPSSDPGRNTLIDSRELVNFNINYTPSNEDWSLSLYGRNIFDERYDNARLNTGDYVLVILSNDASEFGLRFNRFF